MYWTIPQKKKNVKILTGLNFIVKIMQKFWLKVSDYFPFHDFSPTYSLNVLNLIPYSETVSTIE